MNIKKVSDLINMGRMKIRLYDQTCDVKYREQADVFYTSALKILENETIEIGPSEKHAIAMYYLREDRSADEKIMALQILEENASDYSSSALMLFLHYTFEEQNMAKSLLYKVVFEKNATNFERVFLDELMDELKDELITKRNTSIINLSC